MLKSLEIKEHAENEEIGKYLSACYKKLEKIDKTTIVEQYQELLEQLMKFSRIICAIGITTSMKRKSKYFYKKLLIGISQIIDNYIKTLDEIYQILLNSDLNSQYYYDKAQDIKKFIDELNEKIKQLKIK